MTFANLQIRRITRIVDLLIRISANMQNRGFLGFARLQLLPESQIPSFRRRCVGAGPFSAACARTFASSRDAGTTGM